MGAGPPVDWAAVRERHPGALRKAYLDNACKGIPPPEAVAALEAYASFVRECPGSSTTEDTIEVMRHLDDARAFAARLIGAHVDEIALVESTQHGLNTVAQLLDLKPGDRVVAGDIEFFGTILPWRRLESRGIRLDLVPHQDGVVSAEDLAGAIEERTRVVVVSSVQEVTGYTVDLAALSQACRSRGVLLVVDGAQHVGPVPLDVSETIVDAVAVGGHKWLCSPFGLGFLYVRRELLERLEPAMPGYMAIAPPAEGWASYLENPGKTPRDDFEFVRGARKLELGGTGPYAAAAALAASLSNLVRLGPGEIAARVRLLVETLTNELRELGLDLSSSSEPERMSGIVVFRVGRDPEREQRLVRTLADAGVAVSLRFSSGVGGIRVSPYFYNDESDLERLLSIVRVEARR